MPNLSAGNWLAGRFCALEPGANGTVLYVFTIAPAVPAPTTPSRRFWPEAFPNDVQALAAMRRGVCLGPEHHQSEALSDHPARRSGVVRLCRA